MSHYAPDCRVDTRRSILEIDVPVLAVAAGEDDLVPWLMEKEEPLVGGQRVKLTLVEGSDHFLRALYGAEVADPV